MTTMTVKPYHAELNRLRRLLDMLATSEAEFQIQNHSEYLYPTILNDSTGIVECKDN